MDGALKHRYSFQLSMQVNSISPRGFILSKAGAYFIIGTLSNRRRQPDDGNRKRDISLETSLRMNNTLGLDVALKSRT